MKHLFTSTTPYGNTYEYYYDETRGIISGRYRFGMELNIVFTSVDPRNVLKLLIGKCRGEITDVDEKARKIIEHVILLNEL